MKRPTDSALSVPRRRGRPPKPRAPSTPLLPFANADAGPTLTAVVASSHLSPAKVTPVYDSYWRFAAERQQIFFQRVRGASAPWTTDPVLSVFKFTNAYRASDRVSQYLIRRVIYRDDLPNNAVEVVFRTLLFKLFNKIETWKLLENALGTITYAEYDFRRYDSVLSDAMRRGLRIYSAAYIMPPGATAFGHQAKHQNHLKLLELMMAKQLPQRLSDARSMQEGFELLRNFPTIGDFLAYQFVTDINYSDVTNFSEMDFVIPGPGARDGLKKCFADPGGLAEPELIRLMADNQEREFERLGLEFPSLWGRPLQLIDCQNLFCEVDKYARVMHPDIAGRTGRTRIKQKFAQTSGAIDFWYPPKWGLNEKIAAGMLPNEARMDTAAMISTNKTPSHTTTLHGNELDFRTYQMIARQTDQVPGDADDQLATALIVPLLGLAGETGQLLSEYKKHLRDGEAHRLFKDRVSEELGDLLWYVANVASKFDLDLSDVANQNLRKVRERWSGAAARPLTFDGDLPEGERFPRRIEVELVESGDPERPKVLLLLKGEPLGAPIGDNAYDLDGYQFHDVFHLAYAAILGWSPNLRAFLKRKRRSSPLLDEVEDGGRARVIEEAVAALVFDYARVHNFFDGVCDIDYSLLRTIKSMTSHLEVGICSAADWRRTVLDGFAVWRQIMHHRGGRVLIDLDAREISFLGPPSR